MRCIATGSSSWCGTCSPYEEIGCIIPMGEWILRQTCLQGRQWLDQGLPPVTLAVNLSPAQLHQPGLVEMVRHILDTTGYPAALLELELTESDRKSVV